MKRLKIHFVACALVASATAHGAALVIDTDGHTSLFVDPVRVEPIGASTACKKINSMVTTGSGSSAVISDGRVYVDQRDCEEPEEEGDTEKAPAPKPAQPQEPKSILKHYQ